MLYTLFQVATILSLAFSQCTYDRMDSKLNTLVNDVATTARTGQYVVYDWSYSPGVSEYGAYYLPYLFTDTDGETICHSATFGSSASLTLSCSTGYDEGSQNASTIVMATYYGDGACTASAMGAQIWWQYGYSPYFNPETGIAALAVECSSVETCEALNYTRLEVTMGSGSRYDFNCEGDVEAVDATLCISPTCDETACASVSASRSAHCIQTPTPGGNLGITCNSKKAWLNTFVDVTQLASDPMDYTLARSCQLNTTTNFLCNSSYVDECDADRPAFTTDGLSVYGSLDSCGDSSSATIQTVSFGLLLVAALFAIFKA